MLFGLEVLKPRFRQIDVDKACFPTFGVLFHFATHRLGVYLVAKANADDFDMRSIVKRILDKGTQPMYPRLVIVRASHYAYI